MPEPLLTCVAAHEDVNDFVKFGMNVILLAALTSSERSKVEFPQVRHVQNLTIKSHGTYFHLTEKYIGTRQTLNKKKHWYPARSAGAPLMPLFFERGGGDTISFLSY